jgi:hypothetical protein
MEGVGRGDIRLMESPVTNLFRSPAEDEQIGTRFAFGCLRDLSLGRGFMSIGHLSEERKKPLYCDCMNRFRRITDEYIYK